VSVQVRAPELVRLVRFCEVGATNTAVTLLAYGLLLRAGTPTGVASALAFAAGAVNGYHWNARWTFAGHGARGRVTRLRYVAVQGAGALASAAGVTAVHAAAGLARLPAEAVILPAVTVLTYALMRTLVFGAAGRPAPGLRA
jgi:putative flippase GtrA